MFILIFLPAIFVYIDFLTFLVAGRRLFHNVLIHAIELLVMILLPFMYADFGGQNDCCGDSTPFSPHHQLTIAVLCILSLSSYIYCSYRKKIATPIIEVLVNSFLVVGIILNIFIAIQAEETFFIFWGSIPVIVYGLLVLIKNQQLFIEHIQNFEWVANNKFEVAAIKILSLNPILKYPVFFVLCLPILIILSAVLLLFGQKPDSVVRAFTETYKHGFSQWDYQCENVECGGHYLCSVAANGHAKIVRPQRNGTRNGHNIICNRQLLVSNAFEDLMQEKFPALHKITRREYNKVGTFVHRYYGIFKNKFLSDIIYILMKPLEWFFLLTLYTFDKKPENRIAKQYTHSSHRKLIDKHLAERLM